jgi:hypothetical protein
MIAYLGRCALALVRLENLRRPLRLADPLGNANASLAEQETATEELKLPAN